jgi:hypothetical protein
MIARQGRSPIGAFVRSPLGVRRVQVGVLAECQLYVGASALILGPPYNSVVTRLQLGNLLDGSVEFSHTEEDHVDFGNAGTLQLTIAGANVSASYCGINLSDTLSTQVLPFRWYPYIYTTYFPKAGWPGPYESHDNFSCDGFSDGFNRAAGTLFTDPATDWVEDGATTLDIDTNELVGAGSMYWDDTTTSSSVTMSLDLAQKNQFPPYHVTLVGAYWKTFIYLYNYVDW